MKNNDKDLLAQLVRTEFKLKYNDSILGFLWVLLKPSLMFGMLYIVFSQLNRGKGIVNFHIYLFLGLILFNYFSESVTFGMSSLINKSNIILKVNFNRSLAVYSAQSIALINLVVNLLILSFFIITTPVEITLLSILYLVVIIFTLSMLSLGISFITSIIYVRVRDLLHITEVFLQLLFYASAIFFSITIVPEKITLLGIDDIPIRTLFNLNPLFILVQAAREAVIEGTVSYLESVLAIGLIALIVLVFGKMYFNKKIKRIAEFF